MPQTRTVFIVEDDAALRRSLCRVFEEHGYAVQCFASAELFLGRPDPAIRGCLVLDVALPGLDGLALQQELAAVGQVMPIVFLTGRADVPASVRAIKAGAADFLLKPVSSDVLVGAVRAAVAQDEWVRQREAERAELRHRLTALTGREREVLDGLVLGKLNKQIAAEMGIVEQTVKFHRARIMERMQARTVAELMYMAAVVDAGVAGDPLTKG